MSTVEVQNVEIIDNVKDYYGKQLKCTADLKTQACVSTGTNLSKRIKSALSDLHDEVVSRYYGCGLVIPEKLEGMKVLDLGSGSGRDCFAISKLVGQDGHVTGIDMTDEQLAVANKYIQYHTQKFGYNKENVTFVKGYIEKLTEAGIQPDATDIIVNVMDKEMTSFKLGGIISPSWSNCVINLSPDKRAVLNEAYKALKVGGELYFSDVYADRVLSEEIRKHEVLWGECISGALCWEELYKFAEEVGFSVPRLVTASPINIDREDFKQVLGDSKFVSATYRLFKLPKDHVAARKAIYNGGVTENEDKLKFDHQTEFKTGDIKSLDSELATILLTSRFKEEFDFVPANKTGTKDFNDCSLPSSKVDPFKFVESGDKTGENISEGCCGPKKCC